MNIRKAFAVHQKTECSEKRSDYMGSYSGT